MDELCRICGSEEGIKVDIFEPGSDRVKKIHKILPITVSEHDPLPKRICHHCVYKVDHFFEFRTTAIKTQEMFKNSVSWLRGKRPSLKNNGELPMVEVALSPVKAISPNERISTSNDRIFDLDQGQDATIVIEDSPPYFEESASGTNALTSKVEVGETTNKTKRSKKPRSRSLWDSKRRRKRVRKSCVIEEVFTTTEHDYQNLRKEVRKSCVIEEVFTTTEHDYNNIENDPLRISPVDNIENNVENDSSVVNSPARDLTKENVVDNGISTDNRAVTIVDNDNETDSIGGPVENSSSSDSRVAAVENRVLTDNRSGANIEMPKYILTTYIQTTGIYIYSCEVCGRTFLNPVPATQHHCSLKMVISLGNDRKRAEAQCHEDVEPKDPTKDFYQCSECGNVFTRHSQLVSHRKKHTDRVESSSDDSFKPFNKRKKHSKRKHKRRLLNSSITTQDCDSSAAAAHDRSMSVATTNGNHNLNGTTSYDNNNSNSTFETTESNFFQSFDTVGMNITRHSLLSSDSE